MTLCGLSGGSRSDGSDYREDSSGEMTGFDIETWGGWALVTFEPLEMSAGIECQAPVKVLELKYTMGHEWGSNMARKTTRGGCERGWCQ